MCAIGIRNIPYRVRVRLERLRNEDEDAAEELYTLATVVPVRLSLPHCLSAHTLRPYTSLFKPITDAQRLQQNLSLLVP
jgi:ribosomal L31e-like protein